MNVLMQNPIKRIDLETAALRAEATLLQDQIADINSRLKELVGAREVLIGLGYESESEVSSDLERSSKPTKEALLEALSISDDLWQTAAQLRDVISTWAGRNIPMGTISPYLTDLKNDGHIVRSGLKVALKLRVLTEEPSFFNENGKAEASPETEQGDSPDRNSQPSLPPGV